MKGQIQGHPEFKPLYLTPRSTRFHGVIFGIYLGLHIYHIGVITQRTITGSNWHFILDILVNHCYGTRYAVTTLK